MVTPLALLTTGFLRRVRSASLAQRGAVIVIAAVVVWGASEIAVGLYLKATATPPTPAAVVRPV